MSKSTYTHTGSRYSGDSPTIRQTIRQFLKELDGEWIPVVLWRFWKFIGITRIVEAEIWTSPTWKIQWKYNRGKNLLWVRNCVCVVERYACLEGYVPECVASGTGSGLRVSCMALVCRKVPGHPNVWEQICFRDIHVSMFSSQNGALRSAQSPPQSCCTSFPKKQEFFQKGVNFYFNKWHSTRKVETSTSSLRTATGKMSSPRTTPRCTDGMAPPVNVVTFVVTIQRTSCNTAASQNASRCDNIDSVVALIK